MKLGPFMAVLFIMYILLGLLNSTLNPDLSSSSSSTGVTFLSILIQPQAWGNNTFLLLLGGAAAAFFGITTVVGIITRSDIVILSGLAGVFLTMGAVPIGDFYSFMTRNIGQFAGCTAGMTCGPAAVIGGLTAGLLALFYAMTVLQWWLWRQAADF